MSGRQSLSQPHSIGSEDQGSDTGIRAMESDIRSPIHRIDGEDIREWLVLGPFFPDDLNRDFLADAGGEANIEPEAGDTVTTPDGTVTTWKPHRIWLGPHVDLNGGIGSYQRAVGYAFCVIHSEVAGKARFFFGNTGPVAVWVNGEQVHRNLRSVTHAASSFEAKLKEGPNRCLVKLLPGPPGWAFAMRIFLPNVAVISGTVTGIEGKPVFGASVRLEQNGKKVAQMLTDEAGNYCLGAYSASGLYDLSTTAGESGCWQLDIPLHDGERRTVHVILVKANSIEGRLLMLDDKTPHVAIPVQAMRDGKVAATTLSDNSGKYRFVNLKPGCYQIRCQVLGGHVYYGEDRGRKRERGKGGKGEDGKGGKQEGRVSSGKPMILQVGRGETVTGIDFHFPDVKKVAWRRYTHADGLPCMTVYRIYRDPDGVMWFGTVGGGVSRYDGRRFANFTTKDGLADNVVWAIHRDPDGVMWFGTRGGVSRYDGKEFINFTEEDGLVPHSAGIWSIYQDQDGTLWFGGDGVSRYDGKGFVNFTEEDGLNGIVIHAIHREPDGTMWFGTSWSGLFRYDGKEFFNFTTKIGSPIDHVQVIYQDPDGVIWFGTRGGGVSYYDGKEFFNLNTDDGLISNEVWGVGRDPDGVMWFGTAGGLSRYDGRGHFVNFTKEDGLPDDWVYSLHCDPDGMIWCGIMGNGVCRYDGKSFVSFTTKDGLADNTVNAVHCDADGMMWFGTSQAGVSRYDGKEFVNFTTEDGLASNEVKAIQHDPDGGIWLGTGGGVTLCDGMRFRSFTTEDGLPSNDIRAIYCAPDGVVWFAAAGGISRYDSKGAGDFAANSSRGMGDFPHFVNFTAANGLAGNDVRAIHANPDGAIWIGSYGWGGSGGISRYHGKELVSLSPEDGLPNTWISAIHCSSDGLIWSGSWAGTFYYDGKDFVSFGIEDELAYGWVNAIYQSSDGLMWFATNGGGVFCYDGIAWASLDARDGLASNRVTSIHQDLDGCMWFGTDGGVTRYRRDTVPPKVYISSVITDRTYRDLSALPVFTSGTRITMEYNAIDFKTQPEKRQYRCRIYETQDTRLKTQDEEPKTGDSIESQVSGLKSDVPYSPPTKQTTFDWTPDQPGTYIFEVQAIDRDLNYSEPASLSLTVEPDPVLVSMQTELNHLRQEVSGKYHFGNIIGDSFVVRQVRALMERAIDSGLTVLITGETGTGKELVAKAIHYSSPRKSHPLLDRNCAAIPKDLLASELFGHRKGAFTGAQEDKMGLFEAASGGTVLLDEISEMSEDAQVHLLRVLEEREVQRLGEHTSRGVDVRIIAMTNRDLMKEVMEGRFREDLYYRLSEFPIPIPPLRERPEDIPLLAEHFLQDYIEEHEKELDGFAPDIFQMLQSYPWPGNVRELRNAVRRAAALAEEEIQTYHFPSDITQRESLVQDILSEKAGYSESLNRFRRRLVEEALRESNGNRTQAAKLLGMSRPNLVTLIKRLGIDA